MKASKERRALIAGMIGCLLYVIFAILSLLRELSETFSRFCHGRLIRLTTERSPQVICWFYYSD